MVSIGHILRPTYVIDVRSVPEPTVTQTGLSTEETESYTEE
jgi:hypothetical protein